MPPEATAVRDMSPTRSTNRTWIAWLAVGIALAGAAVTTLGSPFSLLSSLPADRGALTKTLDHLGELSPVVFIALQILQVVIAPIPGDVTGLVGGFVFGQWWGLGYSTIGLTIGSLAAFGIGRSLGTPLVRRLVGERAWGQLGTATESSGRLLCLVVFFVPGLPKDLACYIFGISRMPFWTFAALSTPARLPGTWVLSAQGAHAVTGDWITLVAVVAGVMVLGAPLYWQRSRIVSWAKRVREAPLT